MDDQRERSRLEAKVDIEPVDLSDAEVTTLISFLKSLTGTRSISGRLGKPTQVPSGLKLD